MAFVAVKAKIANIFATKPKTIQFLFPQCLQMFFLKKSGIFHLKGRILLSKTFLLPTKSLRLHFAKIAILVYTLATPPYGATGETGLTSFETIRTIYHFHDESILTRVHF